MGDDGEPESLMVLEFQVNGGNAWAQAVAFGVSRDAGESCELLDLTIGGMEAAMTGGASLQVAPLGGSTASLPSWDPAVRARRP